MLVTKPTHDLFSAQHTAPLDAAPPPPQGVGVDAFGAPTGPNKDPLACLIERIEAEYGGKNTGAERRTRYKRDKSEKVISGDTSEGLSLASPSTPDPNCHPPQPAPPTPPDTIPLNAPLDLPSIFLPPNPKPSSSRLREARRVEGVPRSISLCGRMGCSGLPRLVVSEHWDGAPTIVSEHWDGAPTIPSYSAQIEGLATCGHRWCPICGPAERRADAQEMARALTVLRAEGWEMGMLTLTLPHQLHTPAPALVSALRRGLKSVGRALSALATPDAQAAAGAIRSEARRPEGLSPDRLAELRSRVRAGSLSWLAPLPEVTVGDRGLHPHYHVLLLCPPDLTSSPWWAERQTVRAARSARSDRYTHLLAVERLAWTAWGDALGRLRREAARLGDPSDYRPSDTPLWDELARATRCAAACPPGHPHHEPAARDLAKARADTLDGAPALLDARRRMAQAVRWDGPVGALAAYTWGAANEVTGAGKQDIWRALDAPETAPMWGRWVAATERARLTRCSAGLRAYLAARAEDCPDDIALGPQPAPPPPRRLVVAEVHDAVVRWAQDQFRTGALLAAAAEGPEGLRRFYLPPALRPLVHIRDDLPDPDAADADLSDIRHQLSRAAWEAGVSASYWTGPDGLPLAWTGPDGTDHLGTQPPPSRAARLRARTAEVLRVIRPHPTHPPAWVWDCDHPDPAARRAHRARVAAADPAAIDAAIMATAKRIAEGDVL